MNRERRARIQECAKTLETLKAEIDSIRDEEQEYLDNMPENLHTSERYDVAEGHVNLLEDVLSQLEDVEDLLEEARDAR